MAAENETQKRTQKLTYRGRTMEVGPKSLMIDGEKIHYVETDDYIYSHDFAFRHFGSREELAEELIRQWGTARIKHGNGGSHDH